MLRLYCTALLAAALLTPTTSARAEDAPSPAPTSDVQARAQAAATDFNARLRGRLRAAMGDGGPLAAIEVCHAQAPAIAEAVMATHGVRLGRVALPGRNRHPAQAAAGWQLAALTRFQDAVASGAPAAAQRAIIDHPLPAGVALRMIRGIATEPTCLVCHGSAIAPEVRAAIARRYPDDHATGFDLGDLRGALWVEVPSAAAERRPVPGHPDQPDNAPALR